ncbi:hypothetical protein EXIGLDRAFT_675884 [Exidia glandulosa HHB12029]|uniref:Uncharacterized protein n=1 Tax=Exidia glandulosa HHB12029 TaxID=1314781 RepID=A0A165H880_EXIGL|nr:hypothetical protein EXIGLDRAFT_675884 [Exidia glandulosa HHB12029]
MDASAELPRISVDTIQDWQRVTSSLDDALNAALERVISQADNPDALRAHMKRWKDATLDAAKPNLRVNGHNFEDVAEQGATEPFDEALDRSIWALSAERIAWDKTLSDRRRSAPLEVEALVQDLLDKQSELEPPIPSPSDMVVDADASFDADRHREVAASHAFMSEAVHELSKEVPELLRKKELAAQAAQDILASQT